jgi:hypothetical protein
MCHNSPFYFKLLMKPHSFSRLSARQIKHLCMLAGQAYKIARARGAVDDDTTADAYRRAGQIEAANVASLKDAGQHHYLPILGKWFTVIGRLDEAFYAFLNEGPENEARRQKAWLLAGHVAHLAATIGTRHKSQTAVELPAEETARQAWSYTTSIARDKYHGRRLESLDAVELEKLMYTVINRTNAKRGIGDSATRNKSQKNRRAVATNEEPEVSRLIHDAPGLVSRLATRLKESASSRL